MHFWPLFQISVSSYLVTMTMIKDKGFLSLVASDVTQRVIPSISLYVNTQVLHLSLKSESGRTSVSSIFHGTN